LSLPRVRSDGSANSGLADTPYLTSETIFDLNECPRHLVIIGAGRTGSNWRRPFAASAPTSPC